MLQALQYLRRLCSHPLLALDPSNPLHVSAAHQASDSNTWPAAEDELHALHHAPKLAALRDLLQQCDIVGDSAAEVCQNGDEAAGGEAGHRVLVFAQLRAVLDLVDRDVLSPLGIPFLRLDGG